MTMQSKRFSIGDKVLVCHQPFGVPTEEPRLAEITAFVFGGLFEYQVRYGSGQIQYVYDAWLVPSSITICEELELVDIA